MAPGSAAHILPHCTESRAPRRTLWIFVHSRFPSLLLLLGLPTKQHHAEEQSVIKNLLLHPGGTLYIGISGAHAHKYLLRPYTLYTCASHAVLADVAAVTLFTPVAPTPVFANASPLTLFTHSALTTVFANAAPLHSLHT